MSLGTIKLKMKLAVFSWHFSFKQLVALDLEAGLVAVGIIGTGDYRLRFIEYCYLNGAIKIVERVALYICNGTANGDFSSAFSVSGAL